MRVRFKDDFNYTPAADRRVLVEYKAGHELTVKREAGLAAIAAGKAEEMPAAKRAAPEPAKPARVRRPAPAKSAPVGAAGPSDTASSDAEA